MGFLDKFFGSKPKSKVSSGSRASAPRSGGNAGGNTGNAARSNRSGNSGNNGHLVDGARQKLMEANGGRAIDSGSEPEREIRSYGEVPKIVSTLSGGDQPMIKLDEHQRQHMVVIETVGKKAVIMCTRQYSMGGAHAINSAKGVLRATGFGVSTAIAVEDVIANIYRGATNKGAESDEMKVAQQNEYRREIRNWIEYGIGQRATDIHIETRGSHGQVRFRVDGELEAMRTDGRGEYPAKFLVQCMHMLYNMQLTKSGSQSMLQEEGFSYCMVPYSEIPGNAVKLRFQSLKGNEGPKVVARLLPVDESSKTLTFKQLGYYPTQEDQWKRAMETPSGMVLIAGITGSGKSTTQKSFIELNPDAPKLAIFTVEDPVEYPIRYAHQIPIQRDLSDHSSSGKVFGEAVSSLMRADPDIAMLGEVRDRFSANAAQQMAETGHMALGTVHAHLLSGVVPRLTNPEIGMNREVLTVPNMLTLMVYQALVPILCPHCALTTEQALGLMDIRHVVDYLRQIGFPVEVLRWKNEEGCDHCNHRGTVGQTVVAEMMMPSDDWLKAIRNHDDSLAAEVYISDSDHDLTSMNTTGKTIFEHTLLKAMAGTTDVRQCMRFDNMQRYVQRRLRRMRQIQDVANQPAHMGAYAAVQADQAAQAHQHQQYAHQQQHQHGHGHAHQG